MKIALAQVPHPTSLASGLDAIARAIGDAADQGATLVCFPECAPNGMRGVGFPVAPLDARGHDEALARVRAAAEARRVHVLLPMERPFDGAWQNGAYVIGDDGAVLGYQTKNQLPPDEEALFAPGEARRLFDVGGVPIGIVVCHEGWRYPETVRAAAARGAKIVLHPSFCGGPDAAPAATEARRWGDTFYEKAMACRAGENHVWFVSVNFALPTQECASSVVAPDGSCVAAAPLHEAALLVVDVDPAAATGFLARRFAPARYVEA